MQSIAVVLKTNEGGLWILPQISALLALGHQVTLILPEGQGRLRRMADELAADEPHFQVSPVAFEFGMRPGPGLFRGLIEVRRQIRAVGAQVVFYHLIASALVCRFATLGMKVRRVHMVAGPLYLENSLLRRIESVLQRLDSQIIAGSQYTLEKYRKLGVKLNRISAVPYGVDTARFDSLHWPNEDEIRNRLGIPEGAFVAIMVAYVYAPKKSVYQGLGVKGHETALAAWRQFASDKSDAWLILLGSGFNESGQQHRAKLIAETRGSEDLHILWIDTVAEVGEVYRVADVSLSPSLSDNHGAVLEASAMSVPSIVSDAGALPEAVTPETGWVFPRGSASALADRLTECYAAGETNRRQMGKQARALMQDRFELRDCSRKVASIVVGEGIR